MRITPYVAMRFVLPFCALLGLFLSAGCSHYQLGTAGKLSFRTLYIPPVVNKAQMPQAVAVITTQVREAFLRDGRVTLVNSPTEADATLHITLTRYARDIATSRPDDTGLARKFNLNLTALCTLRNTKDNTVLFENRALVVEQQIFATATPEQPDSDQLQAEYQSLPQLAAKLADKVAHAALDVW